MTAWQCCCSQMEAVKTELELTLSHLLVILYNSHRYLGKSCESSDMDTAIKTSILKSKQHPPFH